MDIVVLAKTVSTYSVPVTDKVAVLDDPDRPELAELKAQILEMKASES